MAWPQRLVEEFYCRPRHKRVGGIAPILSYIEVPSRVKSRILISSWGEGGLGCPKWISALLGGFMRFWGDPLRLRFELIAATDGMGSNESTYGLGNAMKRERLPEIEHFGRRQPKRTGSAPWGPRMTSYGIRIWGLFIYSHACWSGQQSRRRSALSVLH